VATNAAKTGPLRGSQGMDIAALLLSPWLGMPVWVWLSFITIVVTILALDLGLFHKEAHEVSMKESAILAGACMTFGFSFSFVVYWLYSTGGTGSLDPTIASVTDATERGWVAWQLYLTGWAVEQALAFDNVFVMSMIFTYFAVPAKYQHRVLFYGILGVIILRALMIGLGAALIQQFDWIMYVFSAFLIFTGMKMIMMADQEFDVGNNPIMTFAKKRLRVTEQFHGQSFYVMLPDKTTGKLTRHWTPLFLALIMIEFADLIFAVDSVPAIFAITKDPFIVYTSNIFAILGLRSLYFVLAAMVKRFHYLKYALSLVLIYVGAKIFVQQFIGKIPPVISLSVTFGLLAGGILYSLWVTRNGDGHGDETKREGSAPGEGTAPGGTSRREAIQPAE
jgi:tellurite resistance protein TerC